MNYVIIELDTTAPILETFAPRYTTRDTVNNIVIKANEQIGKIEKLYVTDSQGATRNLDFSLSNNVITGIVKFNDLAIGTAILSVQVSDTVFNLSEIYTHEIIIKDTLSHLKMSTEIKSMIPKTNILARKVITKIE